VKRKKAASYKEKDRLATKIAYKRMKRWDKFEFWAQEGNFLVHQFTSLGGGKITGGRKGAISTSSGKGCEPYRSHAERLGVPSHRKKGGERGRGEKKEETSIKNVSAS